MASNSVEKSYEQRVAEFRAIAARTGIPVGSLQHAEQLLKDCIALSREEQRERIAAAIYSAYRSGHETGRALQRRKERQNRG